MKKIYLALFIAILLVGIVSASELLTIDNIKQYDEKTQTVTIVNTFGLGRDIATIQLDTPIYYKVPRGYRKVAQFTINSFDDTYKDAFKEMEFYDLNNNEEKFERDFDYKYLTYEEVVVNDYEDVCSKPYVCEKVLIGSHTEQKEVWNDLDTSILLKGKIIIGVFTDVQKGDYVDWIPTLFGKKIDEFATWSESLEVDLIAWYKLDETSAGAVVNSFGTADNGTNNGATIDQVGILGRAYDFEAGETDYVDIDDGGGTIADITDGDLTINLWINLESADDRILLAGETDGFGFTAKATRKLAFGKMGVSESVADDLVLLTNWAMVTLVYDGTADTLTFYINATADSGGTNSFSDTFTANKIYSIGRAPSAGGYEIDGLVDEVGVWTRKLSAGEIDDLWNDGDGLTPVEVPSVVLNSPVEDFNSSSSSVTFNGTATTTGTLSNVSVIVNDTYEETNSSIVSGDNVLFTISLSDGAHNWTYESCDIENKCANATARNFTIDSAPIINLTSPLNATTSTNALIFFNGNVTTVGGDLGNVSLIINDVYNETNSSGVEGNYSFSKTLDQQILTWTYEACNNVNQCRNATVRTLQVHFTPATIDIIEPTGIISIIEISNNQTLTWNITEPGVNLTEHLRECLYTYNGNTFNITDICITTNTTSFVYVKGVNFLNLTVTEEFGITTTSDTTWDYKVTVDNQTFNNDTLEGTTETISASVDIRGGVSLSSASLVYNDTGTFGTIITVGNNSVLTEVFDVPSVETDVNATFFWSLTLSDDSIVNFSSKNQTIRQILIDDCTANNITILNLTLVDEEVETNITGNIEVDLSLFVPTTLQSVINFSKRYTPVGNASICINLLNSSEYRMDAIIKYNATNYTIEYYNIQGFTLNNGTIYQNITLFDLLATDSTEFQISFKDENFLSVENALIQINRQYVSQGVFKAVEIPKTDSNGQTVVHLVEKDVIYNIIVTKEGVILGSFFNMIAFCEDAIIGLCEINLQASLLSEEVFDYDEEIGLNSIFDYNQTSRVITYIFSTIDGSSKNITIVGIKLDSLGNKTVCDETLVSTSGTILCTVPISVGNSSIYIDVFADGILKISSVIVLRDETEFDEAGYLLLFLLVFTLPLLFAQSKATMLIGVVLGFIFGSLLGLVKGGILGVGSSLVWLVIAVMVLMWRLNKGGQT